MLRHITETLVKLYYTLKYSLPGFKNRVVSKYLAELEKEMDEYIEKYDNAYQLSGKYKLNVGDKDYFCLYRATDMDTLNTINRELHVGGMMKMKRILSDKTREDFENYMRKDISKKSLIFKPSFPTDYSDLTKKYEPFYFFDQTTSELFEATPVVHIDASVIETENKICRAEEYIPWGPSFLDLPPKVSVERVVKLSRARLDVDFQWKLVEKSRLQEVLVHMLNDEPSSFFEVRGVDLKDNQLLFSMREKNNPHRMEYLFKVGMLADPNSPMKVWDDLRNGNDFQALPAFEKFISGRIEAEHFALEKNMVTIYGHIS